jgi:Ca2+:H+ antiporter
VASGATFAEPPPAHGHGPKLPDGLFAKAAYLFNSLPPTRFLLLAVPLTAVLQALHAPPKAIFVVSALGVLSLVTALGRCTEEIALYTSPTVGGLLNATFGNVTELIIAVFALQKGLHEIVKASVVGSILGNLLLLLGTAMVAGGLRYPRQTFNRVGSSINVSMLAICLVALVVPAVIAHGSQFDPALRDSEFTGRLLHRSSIGISVILLAVYLLSLLFSLRTHKFVFAPEAHEEPEAPQWPKSFAVVGLLVITILVAWMSDVFVASLESMVHDYHLFTETFMGVVVVAVVGNAAEGSVAIWVARENKMELSFQVAMGSCIQVALFVAPMLVLLSQVVGPHPMTLDFNVVEVVALWASVLIASLALQDGESHWFEGVMFLAVYFIFALVFYYHP